jgi:uncharacterized protein YuzE
MLEIEYTESVDAAYISLGDGGSHKTVIMKRHLPFFAIDLDEEGKLIGIEVLDASKHLPKELLEYAKRIKKIKSEPRDLLSPGC